MPRILKPTIAVATGALAGASLFAGTTGISAAKAYLTGHDIKNQTIEGRDIKNGTILPRDLNSYTKTSLAGEPGPKGDTGATGPAGKDGTDGTNGTDGSNGISGYELVSWTGDYSGGGWGGVKCPEGKVAFGGGYQITDEANLTKGTAIVVSMPGHMDWDTNSPAEGSTDGWIIRVNKPENLNPGKITTYALCGLAS